MRALFLLCCLLFSQSLLAQKTHEQCGVCHSETVKDFLSHPHSQKEMSCDICHGESIRHRTSQGHTEPDRIAAGHEIPELCGSCHSGKESTPIVKQYVESKHGKKVLEQARVRSPHCGTCHGVHNLRQGKAVEGQCKRCHTQLPKSCSAPPPVTKVAVSCTACHSPHTLVVKQRKL